MTNSVCRKAIEVRRFNLSSKTTDVRVAQIIGQDDYDIRTFILCQKAS